jgi:hypothetical protein
MQHRLGFTDQNLTRYSRFISRAAAAPSLTNKPREHQAGWSAPPDL